MKTSDIKIPGVHNVENYMAAIAAVDGLVPDDIIRDFARSFGGVEHRIELVRTYRGVRYYNDSIASSPSRTIAGLRSFPEKVILIAGGYDKHIPFRRTGPRGDGPREAAGTLRGHGGEDPRRSGGPPGLPPGLS